MKGPTLFDYLAETREADQPVVVSIQRGVRELGRDTVRSLVQPEHKNLVDIVAALAQEESQAMAFTHGGFALTALPHRRLADDLSWVRRGHRIRLEIEPGKLPTRSGHKHYGVPYGSRARMILFYLQSEALKTRSREIELGRSLHEWLDRMNISTGGQGYADVREQAARIRACRLTLVWDEHSAAEEGKAFDPDEELDHAKWAIVDGGLNFGKEPRQGRLWNETVVLNEYFYKALTDHPVPLWEPALRQISSSSTAIDIYVWLAYRLHELKQRTPITWTAVYEQFGLEYGRLRDFRKQFIKNLNTALAAYEFAKVEVNEVGLVLHPSPPPVPEKKLIA